MILPREWCSIAHLAIHLISYTAAAQQLRLAAANGDEVRLVPEMREVRLEVLPEALYLRCQKDKDRDVRITEAARRRSSRPV